MKLSLESRPKKLTETYIGKIRLYINILEKSKNRFELLDKEIFIDNLISNINDKGYHWDDFNEYGCDYMLENIDDKIISEYEDGDILEICADLHYKWNSCVCWESGHDEGNFDYWMENEKHRKLTNTQIKILLPLDDDEIKLVDNRQKGDLLIIGDKGRLRYVS